MHFYFIMVEKGSRKKKPKEELAKTLLATCENVVQPNRNEFHLQKKKN